jgi:hypothetical protein
LSRTPSPDCPVGDYEKLVQFEVRDRMMAANPS